MVLYNTRLGREGGKENALFLQAVSISFHNETISMREGPFADFTINYHILQKSIISEAMERREKTTAKSRREEALCISFSLIAFFFISLHDATSDQGSSNVGSAYLYHFSLRTVKLAHWSQAARKT